MGFLQNYFRPNWPYNAVIFEATLPNFRLPYPLQPKLS